jgi:hypothetical protein
MNLATVISILIIVALLALAVRCLLRRGCCSGCGTNCGAKHGCSGCDYCRHLEDVKDKLGK